MNSIALPGFANKFACDPDPWSTWTNADEALKRDAILHALPSTKRGRMLELGAGNGSNSAVLADRSLRLDATEATTEGTALVSQTLDGRTRARALRLIVPARPPRSIYDAIVVAELLYYLKERDMVLLARQVAARLRPGGTLVLAHHRKTFYDFVQHAECIQPRFLRATGVSWDVRIVRQTRSWLVIRCDRICARSK